MKKFSTKAIALLLAMLMMGAVSGCGEKQEAAAPAADGGAAATEAAGTIKIGLNMELSGDVASYGSNSHEGALLAINHRNDNGGVLGMQIEGISVDDTSDAS